MRVRVTSTAGQGIRKQPVRSSRSPDSCLPVHRNQRAYSAQLHTVDLRPPVVLSVQAAPGFR